MNASCVTSSTSAGSRMKRESNRASLRWYFSTSSSNALVAALRPLYQLPVDLAVRHACSLTAPSGAPHPVFYAYVPQTQTD